MNSSSPEQQRSWAEIDVDALRANVALCQDLAGDGCGIIPVVKADAYGHGLATVVRALRDRVNWFGVANLEEAQEVVKSVGAEGLNILILSPLCPDERESAVDAGFAASVSCEDEVYAYESAAVRLGKVARLHLAVDTGMGRMGVEPEAFFALIECIESEPNCNLEGVWTHLPSADEDEKFSLQQIARFRDLVEKLSSCHIHLANSAGLLRYGDALDFTTLARIGLAIYGVSPFPEKRKVLRPVLSWKTRVTLVRDIARGTSISYGRSFTSDEPMITATLAVGYGDGYPRGLSNSGTDVLIAGTRCPLLGRVTMDQIVVDVSHLRGKVSSGDEVVLIGQQGDQSIEVAELAEKADTIAWEIFTGITGRVKRMLA